MSKCEQTGCQGHFGKFQDCLAEAVWEQSLHGFSESTGSTEAYGYFTLMIYAEDHYVVLDSRGITVPAGAYVVESTESGTVYLYAYPTEADARKFFEAVDAEYGEWLEIGESG